MDNCQSHMRWGNLRRVAPPQKPMPLRAPPPSPPLTPLPGSPVTDVVIYDEGEGDEELFYHSRYGVGTGAQMDEVAGRLGEDEGGMAMSDGNADESAAVVGGDSDTQGNPQDGKVVKNMWYCVVCLKHLTKVWQCEICKGCLCWPCYERQIGSRKSVCGQCLTRPLLTYKEGERGPSAREATEGGALVAVEEGAMETYVEIVDESGGTNGGRMTLEEVEAAKARVARQTAAWEKDHGKGTEQSGTARMGAGTSDGEVDSESMVVDDDGVAFDGLDVVD